MRVAVAEPAVDAASAGLPGSPPVRFPARVCPAIWPATCQSAGEILGTMCAAPFVAAKRGKQTKRIAGMKLLAAWLADQQGRTWQQRWLASGADAAGAAWREVPARWLRAHGEDPEWRYDALVEAVVVAVAADLVRPSISWLAGGGAARGGLLVHNLVTSRDRDGFARLAARCDADPFVSATAKKQTLYRVAMILAAKGGTVGEITVGDVVELHEAQDARLGYRAAGGALVYRLLHEMGVFAAGAPSTWRALRTNGQRSPEELIDRHRLRCVPVRDLLVDYLRERQPAMDYNSLEDLAHLLGKLFWSDLERHNPGIDSLRLPVEVTIAWKRRLQTVQKTTTDAAGQKSRGDFARINYRDCLTPVRAFYLDLAHWAVDDPARWGPWVAPCPVGEEELNTRKGMRQRKSRMDSRTRERLPVLPVVVRRVNERRTTARALLEVARQVEQGESFSFGQSTVRRSVLGPRSGIGRFWVDDPVSGKRRDLIREEDHAFWAWAIVEVLRATGVRAEELRQLSHHSLVQYRLPTTGELVPLLQIVPSKTDTERLLLVSPELADVLGAIILRVSGSSGRVPLVAAYDEHEKLWLPPAPLLFQHQVGIENRALPSNAVRHLLAAALTHSGLIDPADGRPLRYTPHDFRRMFITDAVLNGLPPHIAQIIAGHQDINVTMGYKAVYPEEAIQAHLAFLARRRSLRPSDEYRVPTDDEWQEFLGHFERRKVSIGTCARAFSTPCIHEHACVRCPMLWPDPGQRPRIAEIADNLTARIDEAEREGWLGEVDGLQISLAGANHKLAQLDRRHGDQTVELRVKPSSPAR